MTTFYDHSMWLMLYWNLQFTLYYWRSHWFFFVNFSFKFSHFSNRKPDVSIYRENSLDTCLATINSIFSFIVTFPATAKFVVEIIMLSLERYFLSNIRFPANSVWAYMVSFQSCVELKVVSHYDVTIYLMLLNPSLFWLFWSIKIIEM